MDRCPDCKSTNVIPWGDGLICCDCGTEFDEANLQAKDEEYF